MLAKGDVADLQPVRNSASYDRRLLQTGARGRRDHHSQSGASDRLQPELLELVDIMILNETELGFLAGTTLADTDEPARFIEAARRLPAASGKTICVTLGKRGVLALVGGEPSLIAGRAVKAVDTTGAGDCFVGALAAQLANGKAIHDALEYANAAASICVQRMGAAPSMPTAAEVAALL